MVVNSQLRYASKIRFCISIRSRHVPPSKSDLPPLPTSPSKQSPSITTRPHTSRSRARCSLCMSNTHSAAQARLHTAQDSAHLRLWRPYTGRENHGAADEDTTRWKRRGSRMSRCRRTRRYVKRIGVELW